MFRSIAKCVSAQRPQSGLWQRLFGLRLPVKEGACGWIGSKVTCRISSANLRRQQSYYSHSQRHATGTGKKVAAGVLGLSLFGFDKKQDAEDEDELVRSLKWAKLHAQKGELRESEQMYHKSLRIVQSRGQDGTYTREKTIEAQTYIYDNMANLALQSMQLEKAEQLFKETLVGLLEQGRQKTDNAVIEISLKVSMIYAMLHRHSEAEAGYNFCIDSLQSNITKIKQNSEEIDEDTLGLLGMSLNSYARYMMVQKRYDKALEKLEECLDIAKQVLGPSHHQVAVLYSDAATVLTQKGDYKAAKTYIEKALEISKESDSPDYGIYLCNYGVVQLQLGDITQARQHCSDALAMAKLFNDKELLKEAQTCLKQVKKTEDEKK